MNAIFQKWLIAQLRRVSRRWFPKEDARRKAKVKRGIYKCAICEQLYRRKDTDLDHINPVVDPVKGFVDWNTFIERLFCDVDGYQVLCKNCHKKKSNEENAVRRKHK